MDIEQKLQSCGKHDFRSVSHLNYKDKTQAEFFKNYKEEILFLVSSSNILQRQTPLTNAKDISNSRYTLKRFDLNKVKSDAALISEHLKLLHIDPLGH